MDTRALVAAYNGLGHRLYTRLAEGDGNIVLSPVSIGTALAMTLSGARGETEREMRAVLGHGLDRDAMEAASGALIAALEGYGQGPDDIAHIAFANALLLKGSGVLPDYQERVRRHYAAEVMSGAKLETINAWGSAKTLGRVPMLLETVSPTAVAYLLNAMVFVADWLDPCDASRTRPAPFALEDGREIDVATMHKSGVFPTARGDGWRTLRLPCRPKHLALIIGLPDGSRSLASLDPSAVETLAVEDAGWTRSRIDLALPRFEIKASRALADPLRRLGMTRAFDSARADFADLATDVFLSQVQHGASIEVHESGIAATAVTAVEIVVRSPSEPFEVDRPFLFFLTDTRTSAVLMRGRVTDPRA